MLRFYIGFQAIKFYCFPSTTTTFLLFSSSTTTTTATATTFYCFPLTTTTATTATATTFYCFPSTTTTFLLFSSSTTTTTATATTFYCFPLTTTTATSYSFRFCSPRDSIKDYQLPSLVHLVAMSRVLNNNRGFLQLLADCPVHQFLLKTATPQQLHAPVQVL